MIVGASLLALAPATRAALTGFSVTPGLYSQPGLPRHPYVYVPGEVLSFTISGDTVGEQFDAVVVVRSTGQILAPFDNRAIPSSLSLTLTYTIPNTLPDGDDYQVEVGTSTYIDDGRPPFERLRFQRFAVQEYVLRIEVDRPAYIGGDNVTVTWSANRLRDGSLAADGFGQMWVYNTNGVSLLQPSPFEFPQGKASGSHRFRLSDFADPQFDGIVQTWFNDTRSNPIRAQAAFAFFDIDSLGVLVDVTPSQYAPGGIVNVAVTTVVTRNQANPSRFDPPEPGMEVDISVWRITAGGPQEETRYAAQNLVTDAHGRLVYVFQLASDIPDAADFEVRANASHPNGIWKWEAKDTFSVSIAAGLTLVLEFNQVEYQAGDQALVQAIVAGAGGATLTYIFEVRDTTNGVCTVAFPDGGLLATSTQSTDTFTYPIGANFAGQVCFRVTADDGAGNRVTSAREFDVVFGWLLVNADRREYSADQVVTITWELKSLRIDAATATYFYEVRDADGNLVTSGTARDSFQFRVPDPASSAYTFTVTATQAGRAVSGSITLTQARGFFLTVTFDRSSYAA
ncbi:MAG: hypothetical protein HY557_00770, partial [Euryarchaeota archaeon]|nr:hypothetical protein [Euryarchaeota archaeon]